jgi:hypothetical protein
MIVPSVWPEVLDFFGTPIVIETKPGRAHRDAGLLPSAGSTNAWSPPGPSLRRSTTPRDADFTRVLLSRALAWASWQQNGNNIGRVSPT